jgi:hypothetical protein
MLSSRDARLFPNDGLRLTTLGGRFQLAGASRSLLAARTGPGI